MYCQYVLEDWLTISLGNCFVPIQCHEEQSSVKFSTIPPSIHPKYKMQLKYYQQNNVLFNSGLTVLNVFLFSTGNPSGAYEHEGRFVPGVHHSLGDGERGLCVQDQRTTHASGRHHQSAVPTVGRVWDVGGEGLWGYTVWWRFNMDDLLQNHHKRHPIARPLGQDMGCLLWSTLHLYSFPVTAVMWMISYCIGPHYNDCSAIKKICCVAMRLSLWYIIWRQTSRSTVI